MDCACLVVGATVGIVVRFIPEERIEYVVQNLDGWALLFGSVLFANYLTGSYRIQHTYSRFNLLMSWAFSLVFALLMISILSYAWFNMVLGRGVLGLTIVTYSILALMAKFFAYGKVFRSKMALCRTLIIGTGASAREVRETLETPSVLPIHRISAFVSIKHTSDDDHSAEQIVDGVPFLSASTEEIPAITENLGVALVVMAIDDKSQIPRLYAPLKRLRFEGLEVLTPLDVAEIYDGRTPLHMIDEKVMMHVCLESALPMYQRFKRFFDISISLAACVLLTPFALIIGAAIKLTKPGSPVLVHEECVGLFGYTFSRIMFRSGYTDKEPAHGTTTPAMASTRTTWLDRFLRASRLQRLPQLINVLRGEMSLVGPCPHEPALVESLSTDIAWYDERYNILPGITGWAQVRYASAERGLEAAQKQLEYDLFYLKNMSLTLDLQIMFHSLRVIVFGLRRHTHGDPHRT